MAPPVCITSTVSVSPAPSGTAWTPCSYSSLRLASDSCLFTSISTLRWLRHSEKQNRCTKVQKFSCSGPQGCFEHIRLRISAGLCSVADAKEHVGYILLGQAVGSTAYSPPRERPNIPALRVTRIVRWSVKAFGPFMRRKKPSLACKRVQIGWVTAMHNSRDMGEGARQVGKACGCHPLFGISWPADWPVTRVSTPHILVSGAAVAGKSAAVQPLMLQEFGRHHGRLTSWRCSLQSTPTGRLHVVQEEFRVLS